MFRIVGSTTHPLPGKLLSQKTVSVLRFNQWPGVASLLLTYKQPTDDVGHRVCPHNRAARFSRFLCG